MASDLLEQPEYLKRIELEREREQSKYLSDQERLQAFQKMFGGG